jgi:hypothetical protein
MSQSNRGRTNENVRFKAQKAEQNVQSALFKTAVALHKSCTRFWDIKFTLYMGKNT